MNAGAHNTKALRAWIGCVQITHSTSQARRAFLSLAMAFRLWFVVTSYGACLPPYACRFVKYRVIPMAAM
jgi:hypothetical protein